MGKRIAAVDTYVQNAVDFAHPILEHFRDLVHQACPQVDETWKWSFPHFEYQGVLCSMAAFKAHCAIGFWKADLIIQNPDRTAMGQLGRITRLADLPPDKLLTQYIREAARLNEQGVKRPQPARSRPGAKKDLIVPDYFMAALRKDKKARTTFEGFTYSHKKEYVEWITEAKREQTRAARIATALKWLAQGKSRHWQYR